MTHQSRRRRTFVPCALLLLGGIVASLVPSGAARAQAPQGSPDLDAARAALAKYQNPLAAVHDGYYSTVACMEYPAGGAAAEWFVPVQVSADRPQSSATRSPVR